MNTIIIACERCEKEERATFARLFVVQWGVVSATNAPAGVKGLLVCASCARAIENGAYPFRAGAPELEGGE